MTRKQAISMIIEIVEKEIKHPKTSKKKREIYAEMLVKLKEIDDEIFLHGWSQKAILDAVEQFILDNNRYPFTPDFVSTNYLPNPPLVRVHFGINIKDFMNRLFPNRVEESAIQRKEQFTKEWKEKFTEYYLTEYPPSMTYYNKHRPKGFPTIQSICNKTGIADWDEWLEYCGIADVKKPKVFHIKRVWEFDDKYKAHFGYSVWADGGECDTIIYTDFKTSRKKKTTNEFEGLENSENVELT